METVQRIRDLWPGYRIDIKGLDYPETGTVSYVGENYFCYLPDPDSDDSDDLELAVRQTELDQGLVLIEILFPPYGLPEHA